LRREGRSVSAEPVCSCAFLFAQLARETAGAASTRSSLRPQFSRDKRRCKPRTQCAARTPPHIHLSLPAKASRRRVTSIPETVVIEPISRGAPDPPPSRRMTAACASLSQRHCERSEAIHVAEQRKNGLLRSARNDGERAGPHPSRRRGACHRARLRATCWWLLRMRSETLMVRSAAGPRVSNHEAPMLP
jgi:hypothetical protein